MANRTWAQHYASKRNLRQRQPPPSERTAELVERVRAKAPNLTPTSLRKQEENSARAENSELESDHA